MAPGPHFGHVWFKHFLYEGCAVFTYDLVGIKGLWFVWFMLDSEVGCHLRGAALCTELKHGALTCRGAQGRAQSSVILGCGWCPGPKPAADSLREAGRARAPSHSRSTSHCLSPSLGALSSNARYHIVTANISLYRYSPLLISSLWGY